MTVDLFVCFWLFDCFCAALTLYFVFFFLQHIFRSQVSTYSSQVKTDPTKGPTSKWAPTRLRAFPNLKIVYFYLFTFLLTFCGHIATVTVKNWLHYQFSWSKLCNLIQTRDLSCCYQHAAIPAFITLQARWPRWGAIPTAADRLNMEMLRQIFESAVIILLVSKFP